MDFEQRQIITGTLLGNGFICSANNPYLCIQHSARYEDYFNRKIKHLECFGRKQAVYRRKNIIGWRSSCSPIWQEFRDLAYVDGSKTISMAWLDKLHAIGLAVWYCDSGCLMGYKNRNVCLRTQSFGEAGNNIIKQYFDEIGLSCELNKSRQSSVIVFNVRSTERFLKIVAEYVPESLHERLLHRL